MRMSERLNTSKLKPESMPLWRRLARSWQLYVLALPAVIWIIVFAYAPMYGVQIAFKEYKVNLGITGSPWIGLKYFNQLFSLPNFKTLVMNTLLLSVYSLLWSFPVPILLALMLNQVKSKGYKKFVQTVTYAPYFISTVVLVSMLNVFLTPSSGWVNKIVEAMGGKAITFMGDPKWFRTVYITSGIWQGAGWGAIIYLAALGGIDPALYEAAMMDGATRMQQIIHIDLPCILPTVVIMLIMNMGGIMNVGYEKSYLMQNSLNITVSEIISTYTYKIGLLNAKYSFSTAVGLLNSVVSFILVAAANYISRRVTETSLW
ncbi:MAG: sugar ABC transporter permease [Clostridia bacterium]|nr:sugar ABC transporter permease [Clostridia bacterium]